MKVFILERFETVVYLQFGEILNHKTSISLAIIIITLVKYIVYCFIIYIKTSATVTIILSTTGSNKLPNLVSG